MEPDEYMIAASASVSMGTLGQEVSADDASSALRPVAATASPSRTPISLRPSRFANVAIRSARGASAKQSFAALSVKAYSSSSAVHQALTKTTTAPIDVTAIINSRSSG